MTQNVAHSNNQPIEQRLMVQTDYQTKQIQLSSEMKTEAQEKMFDQTQELGQALKSLVDY
ncbi:hypothetical protein HanRHA438_Chr17g0825341 [Helianthus annuus]|nr:hypothetical protein HanRHA438_Chr17g0825341 [Helianthus annuus]